MAATVTALPGGLVPGCWRSRLPPAPLASAGVCTPKPPAVVALTTAAEHPAGYRRLSGGRWIASSGDWGSGNQAFALSRGSCSTPSRTLGHGRCFPGRLLSPLPFGSRSAIRPKNLPPSPSRLRRGYREAPRGAPICPRYEGKHTVLFSAGGSVSLFSLAYAISFRQVRDSEPRARPASVDRSGRPASSAIVGE